MRGTAAIDELGTMSVKPWPAIGWAVGIAVVTVTAYLAFLGWDQHKDFDPVTQHESGPYEAWQVLGIGLVLAAVAFAAGWWRQAVVAAVVLPITLTACFAVDAATDPRPDGLWPIGAAMVAVGSLFGTVAVALLGRLVRRTK